MSLRRRNGGGFTLLETVVAMAILGLSLMAIFDLNAGAIAMHTYTKKLTVASLLARSKMVDLEQKLYDEGFPSDDDEDSGDFSEEGWPNFKWRTRVLAPRTQDVSPEQMMTALFNIPMGGTGSDSPISALFGGGGGGDTAGAPAQGAAGGLGALGGAGAGIAQAQFGQMIQQIADSVREVHLTVTWKEGTQTESIDIVTHVVSQGPGGDRNSAPTQGGGGTPGGGLTPPIPGLPPQLPGVNPLPNLRGPR